MQRHSFSADSALINVCSRKTVATDNRPNRRRICKPEMRNGLFAKTPSYLSLYKRTRTTAFTGQLHHGFQAREARQRSWERSACRGIKSQTTVSLSELQCEATESSIGLPVVDNSGKVYPTVVLQALRNMEQYEKCVLLTRVGSFYEVRCSIELEGIY